MGLTGFNLARRREQEAVTTAASPCPMPPPVPAASKRRSKKTAAPIQSVIEEPVPVNESTTFTAADGES